MPLAVVQPGLGNRGGHALGALAGHRVGDGVGGGDGPHRSDCEQVGIARTHPHQGEARAGRFSWHRQAVDGEGQLLPPFLG